VSDPKLKQDRLSVAVGSLVSLNVITVNVTDWQTGLFGEITRVDIRLEDGTLVRDVPVDYFRA
jgi:hypothetical protein